MDYKTLASEKIRKAVTGSYRGRVTAKSINRKGGVREVEEDAVVRAPDGKRNALVTNRIGKLSDRLLSRFKTRDRIASRSPANKLARTILKRDNSSGYGKSGFSPAGILWKTEGRLGKQISSGNDKLASQTARKAATIARADRIAERFKSRLAGPGGKKVM